MTSYEQANASIAAYDSFVFQSVGRFFAPGEFAEKADLLAAVAIVDCEIASRDRKVNQCTRDYYRDQAAHFRAII